MFSLQGSVRPMLVEYTLLMLPNLVACVLNFSVFIVMKRSERLQQLKYLRQNTFLYVALGCLLNFTFYAPIFFLRKHPTSAGERDLDAQEWHIYGEILNCERLWRPSECTG